MIDLPNSLAIDFEPIEINGSRYDHIELREPTAQHVLRAEGELKGALNSETLRKYQIALVSQVSGIPRAVIERMPIRKLNEGSRYLQGFIEAGQATGES